MHSVLSSEFVRHGHGHDEYILSDRLLCSALLMPDSPPPLSSLLASSPEEGQEPVYELPLAVPEEEEFCELTMMQECFGRLDERRVGDVVRERLRKAPRKPWKGEKKKVETAEVRPCVRDPVEDAVMREDESKWARPKRRHPRRPGLPVERKRVEVFDEDRLAEVSPEKLTTMMRLVDLRIGESETSV